MADDGKAVQLAAFEGGIAVTVRPGLNQPPYLSAPMLNDDVKQIERLLATCHVDDGGRRYLEVEAGIPEIGPTYRLYSAVREAHGFRVADEDVPIDELVLVPNTSIGLYDDWEDDLGVPWAYPLTPLQRLTSPTS